ncbi:MAG: bifunctional GNAT family N-acetyltransferase/carbon-nitrogen hydrolase family protein [Myxococcales bacterium]|nr:bifunctional GNAT family N-acetyltransferase/carbon-nitrogen hydrolase family protein [Myxococcales bacterium]MCB9714880.1 bifunctional GNAT family N-acetyltransferase/carbon-nitrogen hydrolase family protein [Myxococcales bacterium]
MSTDPPKGPSNGEPPSSGTGDDVLLGLRHLRPEDYPELERIMNAVYEKEGGAWAEDQFRAQLARFPEGQICIEDHGRVVAAALSLIVDYKRFGDSHTYDQITDRGYISTHDPNGDVLYGMDVFVDPEYRGMRLGRRLYDARKELCEKLNLTAIVAGGRIPGYAAHAESMTPQQYIALVQRRELFDPILSFQLANDFHVVRVLVDYWPLDRQSGGFATLLRWSNIYYEARKSPLIGEKKTVVRLGTVQWQMRGMTGDDDLMQQVEFFVDALAGFNADFALFPEFFSTPLLAQYAEEGAADSMRKLAGHTESLRDTMLDLAVSYNINIIAGSMPLYRDRKLYNVSYLLRRNGTWEAQYKLHVTPDERSYWGVVGGTRLRVFETDVGKVGILICYDVEFPELARLLADQGMQILFVPFWTDTKNGYLRVRRCAQARAIENECYVAITGSVGSLPKVENIDIQYSQTAVFSPSDFAFPHDAIMAEATPNTETTLITDVDLDDLKELRSRGSVRNFQDRRLDLYRVQWVGKD